MNTLTSNNSRIAGVATAVAALAIVGMGVTGADAFTSSPSSFETAPALSCPSADRAVAPHTAAEQLVDAGLTATQVANLYVLRSSGWTATHFNALGTTERAITGSKTAMKEIDIRDMGMRRIAVFVASNLDGGWVVTRTFECATPKLAS